jgi:hypothetical protein
MTLPTIVTPTYNLIIPSNNKSIKYRPFLVKEEKLLLMAKETDSILDNIDTIKQIIENCIITNINVNTLSTFDIEYIFIQLRSKSVGNIIILNYEHDCPINKDQKEIKFNIDLDKVTVENNNTNNTIKINDNISIVMKYPTFNTLENIDVNNNIISDINILANSIDYITDGNTKHDSADYTHDDIIDFLEALTSKQLKSIYDFFDNIPTTEYNTNIKCQNCDFNKDIKITGITDFFV